MKRKSRQIFTLVFMLMFAVTTLFASFADTAWAEGGEEEMTPKEKALAEADSMGNDEDGNETAVHKDPTTFEKNFVLTVDQKKYTITEIEKVVDEIIDPEMSDLEKYYTLAKWVNNRVKYDGDFWNGGYNFEYYSHQWDSYGGMKEGELSVCVGISIFYATMCHAADLPCRFVRVDPDYLDHTINYIPDINGNAYYVDVTENNFLMSDKSGGSFTENIDKDFAHITKDATDNTFDATDSDGELMASELVKARNDDNSKVYATYDEWMNEYAYHKNTKKKFDTPYVENGSGLRSTETGYYHASYNDLQYYPSQHFLETPGIWFLDDFYANPADIEDKILKNKFDEQLLNVSGVKQNYDCDNEEALVAAVSEGISMEYFPSCKGGKVVAEATPLTRDEDYQVTCTKFDLENGAAELEISGLAPYSESITIPVKLNSAAVEQAPAPKTGLTYNGSPQELIEPGTVESGIGEMQYAIGTKTEPKQEFSAAIPTATDAGEYYVWYKAAGDATHKDSEIQFMDIPVKIAQIELMTNATGKTVKVGKTVKLSPKVENGMAGIFKFESEDKRIATVDSKGVVKGLKPGTVAIFIESKLKDPNPNYHVYGGMVQVKVVKGDNPMTLKAKTVKVKYKALKKKAKVIARKKAFTVSKQQGSLSYKLVSAKKGGKNFKKKFRINAKTGKVTVKKGLKKGTYKVTVSVKAKGNSKYKASAWKKVTFKVKVK